MDETTKKPRTRKKPPVDEGPTEEELFQQAFAIEVDEAVSRIVDREKLDRMMLKCLAATVEQLVGSQCSDHPSPREVQTLTNDAVKSALERIERICNNDRPPYQICRKCGE